jgi:outer membrane protein insertion porin family
MDATPVYLKRGFLKVSFGEAQAQVVSDTTDGTVVDVKLPVTEGIQYKLAAVEWTGNSILPADKLQPLIRGKAGDVANAVQLEQDFEAVRRLYGSRGYVKATTTPQLKFDDAASTVAYTVQVKEGELYRMGDLDIEGLDSKTVARLRTEWKLRQGEPYDCSYPKRFFTQSEADLPTDVRWKVTVHETVNDSDKTVDVTLQYSSNGP